jgi:FkbM family methyltransferase
MDKDRIYKGLNKAYFSNEMHEKEIILKLPELLRGVELFVDIGASLGQYTYFASRCMNGGHIVAIEADPIRFEELERNCRKWESTSNNKLSAMNGAACDRDGQITFYTTNTSISGGLFAHDISQSVLSSSGLKAVDWNEIVVDCFTLDSLFENRSPDFVKVDVEGGELRVLKGASRILTEGKAKFLVELHGGWIDPESGRSPSEIGEFMRPLGYYSVEDFSGRVLFVKLRSRELAIRWLKTKLNSVLHKLKGSLVTRRAIC